jgi:hypothetical protein
LRATSRADTCYGRAVGRAWPQRGRRGGEPSARAVLICATLQPALACERVRQAAASVACAQHCGAAAPWLAWRRSGGGCAARPTWGESLEEVVVCCRQQYPRCLGACGLVWGRGRLGPSWGGSQRGVAASTWSKTHSFFSGGFCVCHGFVWLHCGLAASSGSWWCWVQALAQGHILVTGYEQT